MTRGPSAACCTQPSEWQNEQSAANGPVSERIVSTWIVEQPSSNCNVRSPQATACSPHRLPSTQNKLPKWLPLLPMPKSSFSKSAHSGSVQLKRRTYVTNTQSTICTHTACDKKGGGGVAALRLRARCFDASPDDARAANRRTLAPACPPRANEEGHVLRLCCENSASQFRCALKVKILIRPPDT